MAEWKDLSGRARRMTLAGVEKARTLSDRARCRLEMLSGEEKRLAILAEMGRRLRREHPDPLPGYEDLYMDLTRTEEEIAARRARLEEGQEP